MKIYFVVTCLLSPSEPHAALHGPFGSDTEANDAYREFDLRVIQDKVKGYQFQVAFLKTDEDGTLAIYNLPRDDKDRHSYRVHLETGSFLKVAKSDSFPVHRPEQETEMVFVTDLQVGDRIVYRTVNGPRTDAVSRVERVSLFWGEAR